MIHISELLTLTAQKMASDLHLSSTKPPAMRINGDMIVLEDCPPLNSEQVKTMIYSIMTDFQRSKFEEEMEMDFALAFTDDLRFRVNAFNTIDGPAAVFRVIPNQIRTLANIGAPQVLSDVVNRNKGLVLVTGPTGSGKSTTLAGMLDLINEKELKHIITIEDPIEFVHKSKKSLINQREVGGQTKSFARALKSALREDPDVILVGEMRDLETIQLALTAAETGHLVLGTLHTSSAPKTIDRIVDVFPAGDKDMIRSMLSNSIEAIITQTLLKRKDGNGRIAAFEIMLGIPSVRNLIREGKILKAIWEGLIEYAKGEESLLIMEGPDALQRSLSDNSLKSIRRIEVVTMDHFQTAEDWCELFAPDLVTRIKPVEVKNASNDLALLDHYDLMKPIESLFQPYAVLEGGGNIIIQGTSALIAIDVNRGADKNSNLTINLEAATEAIRQIRIRNLGGIIMIDFIRMKDDKERKHLLTHIERLIDDDPCTVQIHGFTAMGLLEISRQRRTPTLFERVGHMFEEA